MFIVHHMVMLKVNLHEVKAQLSKYIEMVEAGEVVVVCKRNEPIAEIRSIAKKQKKVPQIGWAEAMQKISANLKDLNESDLLLWEGDENDPLRKYAPKRGKARK